MSATSNTNDKNHDVHLNTRQTSIDSTQQLMSSQASANAMFNACVAASHYYQWQYSAILAKQQLELLKCIALPDIREKKKCSASWYQSISKLRRRRGLPPLSTNVTTVNTASSNSGLSITMKHLEQNLTGIGFWEEMRAAYQTTLLNEMIDGQIQTKNEIIDNFFNKETMLYGGWKLPLLSQLSEFHQGVVLGHEPIGCQIDLSNEQSNPSLRQPLYEGEFQVPDNPLERFSIGTYIKLCIILVLINAPFHSVLTVICIASLHISGVLDPIIDMIKSWFRQAGLTQRRSLTEILTQLRNERDLRLQERHSENEANRLYRELQRQQQERDSMIEPVEIPPIINGNPLLNNNTPLINPNMSSQTDEHSLPSSVNLLQSSLRKRLFQSLKWFYQLFVVFFCSLNPQWRPLTALVLPPTEQQVHTHNDYHDISQPPAGQRQDNNYTS